MLGNIGNHTVAFMDVLGFKKMLESRELKEFSELYEVIFGCMGSRFTHQLYYTYGDIYKKYRSIFYDTKYSEPLCKKFVFSDSIIFISHDDTPLNITKLLLSSWRFLQTSIAFGFLIRGGIAHGELYVNEKDKIFLGKALKSAYELEQKQNWVGVSVDDSIIDTLPWISEKAKDLQTNYFDALLPIYNVPFKDGTAKQLHTVNWRFQLSVKEGIKTLLPFTGNQDEDRKIKNTLDYLKYIKKANFRYCYDDVPYELRPMYFGVKGQPSLKFDEDDEF